MYLLLVGAVRPAFKLVLTPFGATSYMGPLFSIERFCHLYFDRARRLHYTSETRALTNVRPTRSCCRYSVAPLLVHMAGVWP